MSKLSDFIGTAGGSILNLPVYINSSASGTVQLDFSQYSSFEIEVIGDVILDIIGMPSTERAMGAIFVKNPDIYSVTVNNVDIDQQFDGFPGNYNVSDAVSTDSVSISGNPGQLSDTYVSPDGTKMYIAMNNGITNYFIYQYTLATAFDMGTAIFDDISYEINSGIHAIHFKSDGTALYVLEDNGPTILQHTLSTPWDLSTASYASKSMTVQAPATGMDISPDGTKVFVVTETRCYRYSLTTAWDMSTGSYDNMEFAFEDNVPEYIDVSSISFKPDGTEFYIKAETSKTYHIVQYTMSTAWDNTTASVGTDTYAIGAFYAAMHFKSDGTIAYIANRQTNVIHEYSMSIAWDVSTLSDTSKSVCVGLQDSNPQGMYIKPDGTKLYIIGQGNDFIYEYNIVTAWDLTTLVYTGKTKSVASIDTTPTSLFFKPDGTMLYFIGTTNRNVRDYSLSTPWDLSTISSNPINSYSPGLFTPQELFFKPDGTMLYIIDASLNYNLTQHSLSTPWDISTASSDGVYEVFGESLYFSSDGRLLLTLGGNEVKLHMLSTPWDITTASDTGDFLSSSYASIYMNSDGSILFTMGGNIIRVYDAFMSYTRIECYQYDNKMSITGSYFK